MPPRLMLSPSHGERHLLPDLTLTFYGIGKRSCRVRCLLDSGSQRSYLSKDIAAYIKGYLGFSCIKYEINTFLGSAEREFGECILEYPFLDIARNMSTFLLLQTLMLDLTCLS